MTKCADLANLIGNINAGGGGVNRNIIINGAMNVAQRGTSSTGVGGSDGYFTCDRWKFAQATNAGRLTMTQDSSAPSGFANSMKLACTTTDTSIGADEAALIQQSIEGQNLQIFSKGTSSAKPFTVSFYVKGNASATYTVELNDTDNTRYNSQEFSVTTDWTRVTKTFVADTTGAFNDDNSTSLKLMIWLHAGSTYTGGTHTDNVWHTTSNQRVGDSQTSFYDSTDRTLFITGVQLEVGQNATEFEVEPFDTTLEKCQRYYQSVPESGYLYDIVAFHYGSNIYFGHQILKRLRATPTVTFTTNDGYYEAGSAHNTSNMASRNPSSHAINIYGTSDGGTSGYAGGIYLSYQVDAEL
jgi:hypothetical protein